MKIQNFFYATTLVLSLSLSQLSAEESASPLDFAIVNFKACVEKSKLGKKEQKAFEAGKEQMGAVLEKMNKELQELAKQVQDTDYLDSLSSDAAEELKESFHKASQDFARYEAQVYQMLNQANMRFMQNIAEKVHHAAEAVAKENDLAFVIDNEACFFYSPKIDLTDKVLASMDSLFEKEEAAAQVGEDKSETKEEVKK